MLSEPIFCDEGGWEASLRRISAACFQDKSKAFDAIGVTLDPASTLSTTRVLPFSDPRVVEQVLEQSLTDIWKITPDSQLAFSVGGAAKSLTEDDGTGYEVHVIHYSRQEMRDRIAELKLRRLDPHVMMPALYALPQVISTLFDPAVETWAIIDIGATRMSMSVIHRGKVCLSRAFKLGGQLFDEAIARALDVSEAEAESFKRHSAFLAPPGLEYDFWVTLSKRGDTKAKEVDARRLAQVCAHAGGMLVSPIRQTLASFVAKHRIEPERIYLTGGGAKLVGLPEWLSSQVGLDCEYALPLRQTSLLHHEDFSLDAVCLACVAADNIDAKCPLNLRSGAMVHKGSLEYLKDNKWLIASVFLALIFALVFMLSTKMSAVQMEHDRLKATLEEATQKVFGKPLLSYQQISREIAESQGFSFIPERTAFTHFVWLSNKVNDNLSDVEMDLNALDIDSQRKIVTIRGEIAGDDGLPRFMQLLEQYDCFPDEIQEPKTQMVRDRYSFTLRIEANHCITRGSDDD